MFLQFDKRSPPVSDDGIVDRILLLLDTITVEAELDKLSKGRAVGK